MPAHGKPAQDLNGEQQRGAVLNGMELQGRVYVLHNIVDLESIEAEWSRHSATPKSSWAACFFGGGPFTLPACPPLKRRPPGTGKRPFLMEGWLASPQAAFR